MLILTSTGERGFEMKRGKSSPSRWALFNAFVDEDIHDLTPAEFRLLIYYFRNSKYINSRPKNPAQGAWICSFRVSDGRAGKDIGVARSTIRMQRNSLIKKGHVHRINRQHGRDIWFIGENPFDDNPH